jgi:hypothetical protein
MRLEVGTGVVVLTLTKSSFLIGSVGFLYGP